MHFALVFALLCPLGAVIDRVEGQEVIAVLGASGVRLIAGSFHGQPREGSLIALDEAGNCAVRGAPHQPLREVLQRLRALRHRAEVRPTGGSLLR